MRRSLTGSLDAGSSNRSDIQRIATFQTLAAGIMGKQEFIDVALFFGYLIKKAASYQNKTYILCFITRRCHVLWGIFYDYFMACKDTMKLDASESPVFEEIKPMMEDFLNIDLEMVQQHSVTDTNLSSQFETLKEYFEQRKQELHIMIVDELLIHGRALNLFLSTLEQNLLDGIQDPTEADFIRSKFLNSIHLYGYTRNDDVLLLLPRYRECLTVSKIRSKVSWRDLSARFARLIAVSSVNNVAYSWSIRTPVLEDKERSYPLYDNIYDVFHHYRTGIQDTLEDNFIYLYPSDSCVKAICTVRSKRSLLPLCTGKFPCESYQMYVPYIILDGLSIENIQRLHQRIIQDIENSSNLKIAGIFKRSGNFIQNVENVPQKYYRWLAETNELVLSYLLFRKFAKQVWGYTNEQISQLSEYIDYQQLCRNYNWIEIDGDDIRIDKTGEFLKDIWLWNPPDELFDEYMELLLDGTEPFWNGETFGPSDYLDSNKHVLCEEGQKGKDNPIAIAVLDVIAEIGVEAEENAHSRLTSNIEISDELLSSWGTMDSIKRFLFKCQESFSEYSNYQEGIPAAADLYQVSSVLLQAMDLGLVGMNPLYGQISPEKSSFESLFTMIKAGEQALFILPNRFREFIAVLLKMEERWGENREDFKIDIQRFSLEYCKKNKGIDESSSILELSTKPLLNSLLRFMESIWRSGQSIAEWDFALFRTQGLMCPAPWDPTKVLLPAAMYAKEQLKQQDNLTIYSTV